MQKECTCRRYAHVKGTRRSVSVEGTLSLGKRPFVFFDKHLQPGPMQTARRSQTTDRPRKRHDRKRDASNFDDYMLAVVSVALVGVLIAL